VGRKRIECGGTSRPLQGCLFSPGSESRGNSDVSTRLSSEVACRKPDALHCVRINGPYVGKSTPVGISDGAHGPDALPAWYRESGGTDPGDLRKENVDDGDDFECPCTERRG